MTPGRVRAFAGCAVAAALAAGIGWLGARRPAAPPVPFGSAALIPLPPGTFGVYGWITQREPVIAVIQPGTGLQWLRYDLAARRGVPLAALQRTSPAATQSSPELAPDGRHVLWSVVAGGVQWWEVARTDGSPPRRWPAHGSRAVSTVGPMAAWSLDSRRWIEIYVWSGHRGLLWMHDLAAPRASRQVEPPDNAFRRFPWDTCVLGTLPDGRILAASRYTLNRPAAVTLMALDLRRSPVTMQVHVVDLPAGMLLDEVRLSPRSNRIALLASETGRRSTFKPLEILAGMMRLETSRQALYTCATDGSGLRCAGTHTAPVRERVRWLRWMPDGRSVSVTTAAGRTWAVPVP